MSDQRGVTNEEILDLMQSAAGTIYYAGQRLIQLHNTLVARLNSGPHVCPDWMILADFQSAAKAVGKLEEPFGIIDAILHLNDPQEDSGKVAAESNVVPLRPESPKEEEPTPLALALKQFNLEDLQEAAPAPDPNYKAEFDPNSYFAKENGPIAE